MNDIDLHAPKLYFNRELSFLDFNQRVLEQAKDPTIPLLERVKFLCISCSNLDEFFEIRVAGLKELLDAGALLGASDGLSVPEQLKAIQENNPNAPLYPPTAIDRAAGISQGADAGGGLPAP